MIMICWWAYFFVIELHKPARVLPQQEPFDEQRNDRRNRNFRHMNNMMQMGLRLFNLNDINPYANRNNRINLDDQANIVIDFIAGNNGYIIDNRPREMVDVHDHTTQETLIKSYNKLHQWSNEHNIKIDPDQTISEIKKLLFSGELDLSLDKRERAYNTIKTINKVNGYIVSIDAREKDVLSLVWARIHDPVNASVKDQIVNNLFELLADSSINTDNTYCLTGRVTRMIQSLESLDTEEIVNISSSTVINRELQDRVPALIKQYFDGDAGKYEAYNKGDMKEENINVIREWVDNKLRQDYLHSGLLTDTQYQRITREYLEAI